MCPVQTQHGEALLLISCQRAKCQHASEHNTVPLFLFLAPFTAYTKMKISLTSFVRCCSRTVFKHTAPSSAIIPSNVIAGLCHRLDGLARSIFNQCPVIAFISLPALHSTLSQAHTHTKTHMHMLEDHMLRGDVCFHQICAGKSCLHQLDFYHLMSLLRIRIQIEPLTFAAKITQQWCRAAE